MSAPCSESQTRLRLLADMERAATAVYMLGTAGPVTLRELTDVCGAFMRAAHAWYDAPVGTTEDARRVVVWERVREE